MTRPGMKLNLPYILAYKSENFGQILVSKNSIRLIRRPLKLKIYFWGNLQTTDIFFILTNKH
jgi:hypothetical protein